jgi:hypothetical protein
MRTGERESIEPLCPFCRTVLARPVPKQINAMERVPGGECGGCGALYLLDPTGKNVGEIMMQGLELAAARLAKESSAMVAGVDYEDTVLSYNWRTHRSTGEPKGFMDGCGRLYFIKVTKSTE